MIELVRQYRWMPKGCPFPMEQYYDVLHESGRLYFYTDDDVPKTVLDFIAGREGEPYRDDELRKRGKLYRR